MSAFLTKVFLEEIKPLSPWYRYGFLALILAAFAGHASDSSSRHYYGGFVVPLMLLLNHLAFQFRWPTIVTVLLRAAALAWVVVGGILIFTR